METVGQKAAVGPSGLAKPTTNFKRRLGDWGPVVLLTLGSLWLIQGALVRTAWHGVIVRGADYDAGVVKAGAVVTQAIRLTNLSTQPVIVDAHPGCGCTVVDVPKSAIAPFHSGVVEAKVNTAGMSKGSQQRGIELQMLSGEKIWQQTAKVRFRVF